MWVPTENVAKAVWSAVIRTPEVFVKAPLRQHPADRQGFSRPAGPGCGDRLPKTVHIARLARTGGPSPLRVGSSSCARE